MLVAAIGLAGGLLTAGAGALPAASMATAPNAAMVGSGPEVARAQHQRAAPEPIASGKAWLVADKIAPSKATKRGKRLKARRGVNPKGASPIPDPPARR